MNEKTDLSFSKALEALKAGKRVCRSGWNGKNMFIYLRDYGEFEGIQAVVPSIEDSLPLLPHICMKTADNKVLYGWLASQTDMLSDDWCILD
jgi:Protein of unknown function (DUF2829)